MAKRKEERGSDDNEMIRERREELIKNDQSGRRERVGGEKHECEPAKRTAKQSRETCPS